jgi:hypothetical protein
MKIAILFLLFLLVLTGSAIADAIVAVRLRPSSGWIVTTDEGRTWDVEDVTGARRRDLVLAWIAAGNTPAPADQPSAAELLQRLFDRIETLEARIDGLARLKARLVAAGKNARAAQVQAVIDDLEARIAVLVSQT